MHGSTGSQPNAEEHVTTQAHESTWWLAETVDYSQVGSMVALALAAAAVVVSLAKADWPAVGRVDRPVVNADARGTLH